MLTLLIVLICAVIAAWVVSILPSPAGFPVKTIGYVIIGVLVIAYLLRFAHIV